MKAIDNQIRNISSSHQDKHSDKVNSHQHHGKVDKTHRAKIVEFDKLDNDSQIDNDFGLHIIYFLQHGHWKVNDRSHQMEKVWFYNSEPSIDIQEYQNFTRMKPLDEDTYSGIKDYPVCFYDPKYKIMANHHGITFDDQRKRYIIGPITVSSDEMTNALEPVELAAIINKKHHAVINGKKFKNSRAISCRSFNRYFSVSTDYRPKLEALLACSQMLGINQVVAHNGNGGRECIGETGTVLGLNARDSKHAGRMFSMHNCQINPGAGPEITTPWKSYQHEKNRNGLMPLIRRRTMLQL
ncbi:DUF4049 domain-containing protein [Escherichia coli]|uniref:YhiJ/YhiL family protein n=1 Tax=Escherichia coli TaxID=562 RepID=UPI0021B0F9BD|nr:YhiJ/YhiL family protein [Escherichia coli]MBY3016999.1 DUF4049 domain-containing protein [Escherichia coli]